MILMGQEIIHPPEAMTTGRKPFVVGIDVGTSGIRLTAVSVSGKVVWSGDEALADCHSSSNGIHEQDPADWWSGIRRLARSLHQALPSAHHELLGIAVTSTSGTLVAIDGSGDPIRPAILYDDQRASSAAQAMNKREGAGGIRWTASHSAAKAVWLRDAEPESWVRVSKLLHPTDWITGKLTGCFDRADHSNALKLGYTVETAKWNAALERSGITAGLLPEIVKSGEVAGEVCPASANELDIPTVPVVAGVTDGMAGLIASGAASCGDANTTLGTTLVWKVLAANKAMGTSDHIYCHLHPAGLWAPGAASNSGPGSVRMPAGSTPSEELDGEAMHYLPSRILCYPISGKGERFPFLNSEASGFVTGEPTNVAESYGAQLQGVAFVERWGYEVLERSGVSVGGTIFSTGGAASSRALSRLRASTLKRRIVRCEHSNAAFGAAILAASAVHYGGNLSEAIRRMTHVVDTTLPDATLEPGLDDAYGRFREECRRRGYCA